MELIRLLDKLNNDVGFTIEFSKNTSVYTINNVFRVGTIPTEMPDGSDRKISVDPRDATKTSNPLDVVMSTDDQCTYITPITVFNNQCQTKPHISWIPTNHETEKRTHVRKVPKSRYVNQTSATKQSQLVSNPSKNITQSNQYKQLNDESQRVKYTSGSCDNGVNLQTSIANISEFSRIKPKEIEIATGGELSTFMEKPSSNPITFKLPNRLNNNKIQSMEYSHRTRLNIQPENII